MEGGRGTQGRVDVILGETEENRCRLYRKENKERMGGERVIMLV